MERLREHLRRIDGRGYKAYKDIKGTYRFPEFTLTVDHVQADPFAAPSRLRVRIPAATAALPDSCRRSPARSVAARDFIARAFRAAGKTASELSIDAGLQSVLDRTAVLFPEGDVEIRFRVELPGRGRTILGRRAEELLCRQLPEIVSAVTARGLDLARLEAHCAAVEDQQALRDQLAQRGLVAFVGDGAVLPRRSGIDDRPLADGIPFSSPESLRVELEAPNAGTVSGLGIAEGITLIVGGGFHGKSTLLNALMLGIYDHKPGDGRERVVTRPDAVKIRAEDGRTVHAVDLSPFINHLPYGKSTDCFNTELASGSTSQAAALQEALESGAETLLVDEDTSATNFMIRDERMQALVAKEHEPITPFIDRIRELRDVLGVSTVLVMGGSGDYFEHADTVIQMQDYQPLDVTAEALRIAETHRSGRQVESGRPLRPPVPRRVRVGSLDPTAGKGRRRIKVRGVDTLVFGRTDVDLRAVEQLADSSQLRTAGVLMARLAEGESGVVNPVEWLARHVDAAWDDIAYAPDGDLARPRLAEVMAALNRLRGAVFEAGG